MTLAKFVHDKIFVNKIAIVLKTRMYKVNGLLMLNQKLSKSYDN